MRETGTNSGRERQISVIREICVLQMYPQDLKKNSHRMLSWLDNMIPKVKSDRDGIKYKEGKQICYISEGISSSSYNTSLIVPVPC